MKKILPVIFTVAFFVFSVKPLLAQFAPAVQWDKTLGGNSADMISDVHVTSDGGYIIGGESFSGIFGTKSEPSRGNYDYWVVKLDNNKVKQWDKTFGGNGIDKLCNVWETLDGGYILGGTSYSGVSGDKSEPLKGYEDYWVVKLDSNGNKQWDKTIGGSNTERLVDIQLTPDGGFILVGDSHSGISGDKTEAKRGVSNDYWIVKLNSNGIKQWDKTIGSSVQDNLQYLDVTSDGGFILGGFTSGGISGEKSQASKGSTDFWIVKVDSNGVKQWDKTLGGSSSETLLGIEQTQDGGYIAGGFSYSGISGDKTEANKGMADYWVVKLDGLGAKVWDKTIGGSNVDNLVQIHQTNDLGFILAGNSNSGISGDKSESNLGQSDGWIVKLNSSGMKQWDKTVGTPGDDGAFSISQTIDNGYIIGGSSNYGVSGVKTEPGFGGQDYWLVKLAPFTMGINELGSGPQVTIFPNPSQGKFYIKLTDVTFPTVEITVSDLLGRIILQKELQVTQNQITDKMMVPDAKGIYTLQLKAGDQIYFRKIIIE